MELEYIDVRWDAIAAIVSCALTEFQTVQQGGQIITYKHQNSSPVAFVFWKCISDTPWLEFLAIFV